LLLGTGGVMVLYIALNTVYALALSAGEIKAIATQGGKPDFDAVAPIAELAAEQTRSLSKKRRERSGGDAKLGPRRPPPREPEDPDEDAPGGRHVDVRA